MRTLRADIVRARRTARNAFSALCRKILELPSNPRARRLAVNCFVLRWKDLKDNWSVEHHDFETQYRMVVTELRKAGPFKAVKRLRQIINQGYVKDKFKVTLHQDVRENLRAAFGAP